MTDDFAPADDIPTEIGEGAGSEATQAPGEASVMPEAALDDGPDSGPLADAPPVTPERPREVIRGIHAELLCQCEECAPDFVELQWFSVDEAKKVKGDAMLYCARSSRKYFSPINDVQAWLAANGGPRKGRRGSSANPD